MIAMSPIPSNIWVRHVISDPVDGDAGSRRATLPRPPLESLSYIGPTLLAVASLTSSRRGVTLIRPVCPLAIERDVVALPEKLATQDLLEPGAAR